jgi:hypothetical protein
MTRNEEKIIKEQSFFPPAAPNLFQERKTTRTQIAASFQERGKEIPSNYVGNIGMEPSTKMAKKLHIILVSWQIVIAFDQCD